ncbi:MAG: hypothetical protein C4532_02755 [Candidatus Abyssobacteria bacterium SURF_17]|uniref:DUF2148 domain-containing protein n=1 Tax=Candidatus Abyssobacteria bacterium SURF_17 TaxID=2093361 RepID=A0A419F7G4_9BACT|nr:MAG: hypothetical protein C4532_02755 [Candidatus Abyssubacteria bacterium SURF_17]
MGMIDGRLYAQERLLDVAGHALHAYLGASLVTSRLNQKAVIVHGEDIMPMLEFVEKLEARLGSDAAKNTFFPLYVDYMCFKTAMDEGHPPVILVLGADLSTADLGWDCGACGFPTCAEFNKFKREEGGLGRIGAGPSCAWKNFDYGIACDYACAAVYEHKVESRILGTFGMVSFALGYLDDVSAALALCIGPPVELWWYNRPSLAQWREYDDIMEHFRRNYAFHFQMFSSDLRPQVKKDGPWWEQEKEFVSIEADPKYSEYQEKLMAALLETVVEVRPKVEEAKARMREQKTEPK